MFVNVRTDELNFAGTGAHESCQSWQCHVRAAARTREGRRPIGFIGLDAAIGANQGIAGQPIGELEAQNVCCRTVFHQPGSLCYGRQMSRSIRKTPIVGITTEPSDAAWKAKAARKFRAATRVALARGDEIAPDKRWSVENPYAAPKDGKQWVGAGDRKLLRK
jgi:hypothetical protein